ncbi:MAG: IS5 family transposase [Chromatiaceae bacterium]
MKTRAVYPSDISREQFEVIRPKLEGFRRKTKPRMLDLYDVFCGMRYVLNSGCQGRMLPSDYPPPHTVYTYFRQWAAKPFTDQPSLVESLLQDLVAAARLADERAEHPTLLMVDAQRAKNTDMAEQKGYDAGKKVSGNKRHLAVDTLGLPHAIAVTTAKVTDRQGALLALSCRAEGLPSVAKVLVDGGYTGEPFAQGVAAIIPGATVAVVKRHELHTFAVLPKRWIVERSFGWLEKSRRLWKNCERLLNNSLQMVNLAFLCLLLKRL